MNREQRCYLVYLCAMKLPFFNQMRPEERRLWWVAFASLVKLAQWAVKEDRPPYDKLACS